MCLHLCFKSDRSSEFSLAAGRTHLYLSGTVQLWKMEVAGIFCCSQTPSVS